MAKIIRLVIHHSAGSRDKGTAAGIKRFHTAPKAKNKDGLYTGRGWSDIAYHKVIRGSGLLENGRSETKIGAHVENGNTGALGVCLTGHFGKEQPTDAQLKTLVTLLVKWCKTHKLTTKDIYGHHNVPVGKKKPACPGKNMVAKFPWIKDQVWAELNGPKYSLSKRVKDPTIRRILESAINDDKMITEDEVREMIFAVIGDGKIIPQELEGLRAIAKHSKSLKNKGNRGKILLNEFLAKPQKFMEEHQRSQKKNKKGKLSPSQKADKEFYRLHPDRKGKPLTGSKADAGLRKEWKILYKKFGGR